MKLDTMPPQTTQPQTSQSPENPPENMQVFKIEKNIPPPMTGHNSVSKYAFLNQMEVGNSVAVETRRECVAIRDAMRYRKMTYTSAYDPESRKYRIWRLG
jgi:hypothetical protein